MAHVGVALIFFQLSLSAWARRILLKSAVELPAFTSFVKLHGRSYAENSSEWKERNSLYQKRVALAAVHNKNHLRLWTAGINEFWDRTDSELSRLYGWKRDASRSHGSGSGMYHGSSHRANFLGKKQAPVPTNKSWTHLRSTSPDAIVAQGSCGSCWAISASTTLQAQAEIHTSSHRTFSAQQIVACVPNPQHCGGSGGCDGATVELAMEWVLEHGCAQEHEVPYHEGNGQCTLDQTGTPHALVNSSKNYGGRAFGMTGWEKLPENRYQPLLRALIDLGPVAVSVAADQWIYYNGGIFDGCGKDAIVNHAVVMTGFGKEGGLPYWVIQNSWGKFWGEHGSMRIYRHENETEYCGIDNQPQLGTGCIGGQPEVTVCGMCGILYDSVVPYFS